MIRFLTLLIFLSAFCEAATIAIIDTGFDLDHEFLSPKILKNETDEEAIDFQGWNFFDNSHLKKSVIDDKSLIQEILLFRNLKAKGHRQSLTVEESGWYNKKNSDKVFMEKVRLFKRHSHGTFVAGIALREGENISIFPIRGLNIPNPVVAVEDSTIEGREPLRSKTPEDKFQEEIKNSLNRVSRKFSKICRFVSNKRIEVVNASYGITYKNLMTQFREQYKELTGKEIEETRLKLLVDDYFRVLYERGEKTMKRYSHILFVFSAGNSGLNNDEFHHYPSRIKLPNTIAVAAMNGDYLATFSNYGFKSVDIGAPGVAILSIVPKVYSEQGTELYSPASGTSMAAPYVSNLAAQIKNTNPRLTPADIKRIILETGENKEHLRTKLASGSIADNHKALRAALLSKDMSIDLAINLGKSDLIPMEDKISIGLPPAMTPEEIQRKMMDSIPSVITPQEIEEEPSLLAPTKSESSSQKDQVKVPQGNSVPPASTLPVEPVKHADPIPASQNVEQSPKPSEEQPASSSQPQSSLPEAQSPESSPSLPQ
jgi:hypothetical protein